MSRYFFLYELKVARDDNCYIIAPAVCRLIERMETSRFVASKVVIYGDAGGDKDCRLNFRSPPNASAVCSPRFFSSVKSNVNVFC